MRMDSRRPLDGRTKLTTGAQIAPELGISQSELYKLLSVGSMGWIKKVGGKLQTLADSAHYWRDEINPGIHEAVAETRGKAGAAAVDHDERGRFTPRKWTDVSRGGM